MSIDTSVRRYLEMGVSGPTVWTRQFHYHHIEKNKNLCPSEEGVVSCTFCTQIGVRELYIQGTQVPLHV